MKNARIKRTFVVATLASAALLGCELIVDFDRTKIPVEISEAGALDGSSVPPVVDAATPDAADASPDASDASSDATDDAADAADAADQ